MQWNPLVVATLLAVAFPQPSQAIDGRLVVFGDSLSDSGNTMDSLGNNERLFPEGVSKCRYGDYKGKSWSYKGSYSSGPAWPLLLAERWNVPLYNYACGGAATNKKTVFPLIHEAIPDLHGQVAMAAEIPDVSARDLALIWIGSNDYRDVNFGKLDPLAVPKLIRKIRKSFKEIRVGVEALVAQGFSNVAVYTLPPMHLLPSSMRLKEQGGMGSVALKLGKYFLKAVDQIFVHGVRRLRRETGVNVEVVYTTKVFEGAYEKSLYANPAKYKGFLAPCVNHTDSANTCSGAVVTGCDGVEDRYLWLDMSHPMAKLSELWSDEMQGQLEEAFPALFDPNGPKHAPWPSPSPVPSPTPEPTPIPSTWYCNRDFTEYPTCASRISWMRRNWNDPVYEGVYENAGVDGTECSIQGYIAREGKFCPECSCSEPPATCENDFKGFPECRDRIAWLKKHWKDPKYHGVYKKAGIDGSACTIQRYLHDKEDPPLCPACSSC